MVTKDSNISTMNKNKETIKKVSAKVHEELLNTSHLFIDETVATLTRMQKITGKVIKKSEPILEKQIEITFDAIEALSNQANKGGKRALRLFGLTKQYNKLNDTFAKKVSEIPSVEEIIDDAKEMVVNAKSDVEEKIGEIGKKFKIKGIEEIEKKAGTKAKMVKTGAKKVLTKAKVSKVAVTKKNRSKTSTVTKATVNKTTPAKKTKITDLELTQIKGIGPSLAAIMVDNGIKTIKDVQNATPTALKIIATKAGNRYKSFDTKKWIAAAKAITK